MGCGRVGSTLAHSLESQRARRRGHRPGQHRVPPARHDVRRPPGHRRRLRPRHPGRGRHRAGRRLRRRQQRRQLQHPRRAGRPRDVRRRERRRPHLRPRPRRGLPAARHPHRRHRALDRRPDAAPAAARGRGAASWRDPSGRVVLAEVPVHHSAGSAAASTEIEEVGRRPGRLPHPARRGRRARRATPSCQEGDLRARGGGRRPTWPTVEHALDQPPPVHWAGRARGHSHARRHRRRRQRRPLDRPRAARERPRGAAHRQGRRRPCRPGACPRRQWLLADACEIAALRRGRAWPTATSSSPPPATTRSTSSSRCWPRPSSACRASSPGSTTRRTSGCSTRRGASTSPSRRRA